MLWHQTFNPARRNAAARPLYTAPAGHSFGVYDLILPPEPFIHGVNHIAMPCVPLHIPRPPYVGKTTGDPASVEGPYMGDGRIELAGEDERKLRNTANLAKLVLSRAKDWVKVRRFTSDFTLTNVVM